MGVCEHKMTDPKLKGPGILDPPKRVWIDGYGCAWPEKLADHYVPYVPEADLGEALDILKEAEIWLTHSRTKGRMFNDIDAFLAKHGRGGACGQEEPDHHGRGDG